MNNTTSMDEVLDELMHDYLQELADDLVVSFDECCPVCEAHNYRTQAMASPIRSNDPVDDTIHYCVWMVCMGCGTIFDTYELYVDNDGNLRGKLEAVDIDDADDAEFVSKMHMAVGYKG